MASLAPLPSVVCAYINTGAIIATRNYNNPNSVLNGNSYEFGVTMTVVPISTSSDPVNIAGSIDATNISVGQWLVQPNGFSYLITAINSRLPLTSPTSISVTLRDVGLYNALASNDSGNNYPLEGTANLGVIFSLSEDGSPVLNYLQSLRSAGLGSVSYWIDDALGRFENTNYYQTFYTNKLLDVAYSGYQVGQVVYIGQTGATYMYLPVDSSVESQVEKSFGVVSSVNQPELGNIYVRPFGKVISDLPYTLPGDIGDVLYYSSSNPPSFCTNILPAKNPIKVYIKLGNRTASVLYGPSPRGSTGSFDPATFLDYLRGLSGASGPTGLNFVFNGITGPTGPQGLQGTQGVQGPTGSLGPSGPPIDPSSILSFLQGASGISGTSGINFVFNGVTGPTGPLGPAGPPIDPSSILSFLQGVSGTSGASGLNFLFNGVTGPQGFAGPVGPQGPQGFAGPQGPQGIAGPQGPQGFAGPAGPQGAAGVNGSAGPQGPQGVVGLQGLVGPRGDAGIQGPVGPQGPAGQQGVQGVQGVQGIQGAPGPQGFNGVQGDAGPQGITGPTGPQGIPGARGATGTSADPSAILQYIQALPGTTGVNFVFNGVTSPNIFLNESYTNNGIFRVIPKTSYITISSGGITLANPCNVWASASLNILSTDTQPNTISAYIEINGVTSRVFLSSIVGLHHVNQPGYLQFSFQHMTYCSTPGFKPISLSVICTTCTNSTVSLQEFSIFSLGDL